MRISAVFACMSAASSAGEEGGVQKVIQLLDNMADKGKAEMQDEQVKFARFSEFCKNTEKTTDTAIEKSTEQISELEAEISQLDARIGELGREVEQHSKEIDEWTAEKKQVEEDREKEHKEFLTAQKESAETIDAVDRMIISLKKTKTVEQGSFLLQLRSQKAIPSSARRAIEAFLADDPEDAQDFMQEQEGVPEAAAYESHSQGLIDMLDKLLDKFRSEKADLEKEEMNAQGHHDLVVMDLKASIKGGEKQKASKEQRSQEKAERLAAAKGELGDTQADLAEDEAYLAELQSECRMKHEAFADRQKLRKEELEALHEARDVLTSPEMSVDGKTARDQKFGLNQQAVSLVQLRSGATAPLKSQIVAFLESRAAKLNSPVLAQLVERARDDVFGKVKKMIKDMLQKLMEEAQEEAEHKGWCDTEMGTNKQTRDTKTQAVQQLNSEIEELETHIDKTSNEIGDLTVLVQELEEAMAKATADREEEKAKNAVTIQEAKEAQHAVEKATKVLRVFYEKAGKATALFQHRDIGAPETFDEPYTGMGGESGGVVGLLEVIFSDFKKLETETAAKEEQAEGEFQKFITESKKDARVNKKKIEHENRHLADSESKLTRRHEELASTTEELEAAERYYEKLRPSCVDEGVSYEERVSKRQDEIDSLKQALELLNGGVEFSGRSK
mmetsp:Transcript_49385/g.107813  ORF Transcript_49385/g.107813 Transcript_49385/m.107813 type:complete len:675 (+) Transcript_49385:99-2123(+)